MAKPALSAVFWVGDLWTCPNCQATIVSGTGRAPVSEHYKPDFDDRTRAAAAINTGHGPPDLEALIQVNDC